MLGTRRMLRQNGCNKLRIRASLQVSQLSIAGFDRLGRIVRTAGEVRQTRPEGSDQIQPGGEDFKEHVACRG